MPTSSDLLKARLISFGYSLAALAITTLATMLLSSDFAQLVIANFGDGVLGSLVLLGVTELAKHLRNLAVIKSAGGIVGGAQSARELEITLI